MSNEFKCAGCNRIFNSETALSQHNQAKHSSHSSHTPHAVHSHAATGIKKKSFTGRIILYLSVIISIALISYMIFGSSANATNLDSFAKCLTEKGAVVYGNDFCTYTGKQLNWFGKSEQYLNYVKCADNPQLCISKGVRVTPTWEINGQFYPEVQTFETISKLTGCQIN